MADEINAIPGLVRRLYEVVGELERQFEGRKFTPDGHLVGSIGEVLAAHHYGIDLYPASAPIHDGRCGAREVQIKATQGRSVALRSEPDHLLVLKLDRQGGFSEAYNGPGCVVWAACGALQSNGQRVISLSRLAALMESVDEADRLKRVA